MNSVICVKYLLDVMGIRLSVLAALLNVKVETLVDWMENPREILVDPIKELDSLTNAVAIIQSLGPQGKHIYGVLNEPVNTELKLKDFITKHPRDIPWNEMVQEIHRAIDSYNNS